MTNYNARSKEEQGEEAIQSFFTNVSLLFTHTLVVTGHATTVEVTLGTSYPPESLQDSFQTLPSYSPSVSTAEGTNRGLAGLAPSLQGK